MKNKKIEKQGEKKMNKSYNPFKMWGSYVGLVIGILSLLDIIIENPTIFGGGYLNSILLSFHALDPLHLGLLLNTLLGFLLGWGIHSFFRRFSKW